MSAKKDGKRRPAGEAIVKSIIEAVDGLEYGSVLIKVHAGKIVQLEVTERRRFNDPLEVEKGGGI
jgi:hypothetical protein